MIRRISAHVMNIFTKINFNFEWLYLADFSIANTNNGFHLS